VSAPDFALYRAALDADTAFHDALVRAYGKARASDARYQYQHADADVIRTAEAKRLADEAWRASTERAR
jgi:hypothetical protein